MENKLYSLVLTFTPKEFKEFGDLVSSPFFNKEKIYVSYYNILKVYFPVVNNKDLTPEKCSLNSTRVKSLMLPFTEKYIPEC